MTLRLALLSSLAACGSPAPKGAEAGPAAPPATPGTPAAAAPATPPGEAPAGAPQTEDEKVLYALGQSVGMSLEPFRLAPGELAQLERGLEDYLNHRPSAVVMDTYGPKVREFAMARAQAAAKANAESSVAFLKKLGETAGATTLPSGVVYVESQAGSGAAPKASDVVTVHYRGTLADGTEFDSSYGRGEPAQFPLQGVIPCWTEGLQKMKVGGKAKLGCPSALAYGDQGQGQIPPGAALQFEVELLSIGS